MNILKFSRIEFMNCFPANNFGLLPRLRTELKEKHFECVFIVTQIANDNYNYDNFYITPVIYS